MKVPRWISDEGGQTTIVAVVCMVVLIGFVGFAIDVGHLRYQKRQLQTAADAVALAAAREIRVCGVNNTPDAASCTYMTDAAKSALAENQSTYNSGNFNLASCATATSTDLILDLNSPPQGCLSASDPNTGKTGYVEAVVSQKVPTYFAGVLGIPSISLTARAEATRNLSPPCVYALDPTTTGTSMTFLASVVLQANCAIIDESPSPVALVGVACLIANAPKISVAGNDFALLALGCPNIQTNVPPPTPADPLAYLPPPSTANDPCGGPPQTGFLSTTYTGAPSPVNISLLDGGGLLGLGVFSNITFNPGVYCGGINITLNVASVITFNPGVYILRPQNGSGGLNMFVGNVASVVTTGTDGIGGVMFYNEGPAPNDIAGGFNINIPSLLGVFNLTAPTSGEYAGMLFYQPSTNTAPDNFLANLVLNGLSLGKMDGAIYAPSAQVFYGVDAVAANNNILVAKDITFLANLISTFGTHYAPSSLGSPLVGDDAVLVQ